MNVEKRNEELFDKLKRRIKLFENEDEIINPSSSKNVSYFISKFPDMKIPLIFGFDSNLVFEWKDELDKKLIIQFNPDYQIEYGIFLPNEYMSDKRITYDGMINTDAFIYELKNRFIELAKLYLGD